SHQAPFHSLTLPPIASDSPWRACGPLATPRWPRGSAPRWPRAPQSLRWRAACASQPAGPPWSRSCLPGSPLVVSPSQRYSIAVPQPRSSGLTQPMQHISYPAVNVHPATLPIASDPSVKLAAPHQQLAAHPVAGQRVLRVLEALAQLTLAHAAVGRECLQGKERVKRGADDDP